MFSASVWTLAVDSSIAKKEAEKRFNDETGTIIEAVAGSSEFDQLTRYRLETILKTSMTSLCGKSFFRLLSNQRILMAMEGWGRNVPVLKKFNPESIVMVDINPLSIIEAKNKFASD